MDLKSIIGGYKESRIFHAMQKYMAECAGGEWDEHGCWSYDGSLLESWSKRGLEVFLSMETPDDTLVADHLSDVAASIQWLVAERGRSVHEDGLEYVYLRDQVREFARYCLSRSKDMACPQV